jgi:hypothetical protein
VRCVRCKATWFAETPAAEAETSAPVGGTIAAAEAQADAPPHQAAESDHSTHEFGGGSEQPVAAEAVPHAEHLVGSAPPPVAHMPVADAPSLVPPLGETGAATHDSEDIESFAVRRDRLRVIRQSKRHSSRWTAIILILVAFNVAAIGARNEVVRYLPQTASLFAAIGLPVNLRNLKFENVKISSDAENGINGLRVDGTIVSTSSSPIDVPRLRFSVHNAGGQEIYTWTAQPEKNILEPDEELDFHMRLASPPADGVDVLVRFFNARDAAAATN